MTPVSYELDESTAWITMDDGKANALSFEMLDAIGAALDRAEADQAAVVLCGREGRFSGGFDLKVLLSAGPDTPRLLRAGFELSLRMLSLPLPVVVACTGHAYAMGAFLLLSGDHRIGIDDPAYRITANEVAIGMTMPRAAIEICRQRLSPTHHDRAVILAEVFDPAAAVTAGFLDAVVPAAELRGAARAKAAELLTRHPGALAGTKARVRAATFEALRSAIEADDAELQALI
jgi:enoyl-CoA hydratase